MAWYTYLVLGLVLVSKAPFVIAIDMNYIKCHFILNSLKTRSCVISSFIFNPNCRLILRCAHFRWEFSSHKLLGNFAPLKCCLNGWVIMFRDRFMFIRSYHFNSDDQLLQFTFLVTCAIITTQLCFEVGKFVKWLPPFFCLLFSIARQGRWLNTFMKF